MLHVAEIINYTESEGPNLRTAIWFQGCSLNCKNCCNTHLFDFELGIKKDPKILAQELSKINTDGITLLGGEPLQQKQEDLFIFLTEFRKISDKSIMLFSGFTWDYIQKKKVLKDIVDLTDLVIAGPYLPEQTPDNRRWIGSKNQTIHFLTEKYRYLEKWPLKITEIEIHFRDDEIIINGTPFNEKYLMEK